MRVELPESSLGSLRLFQWLWAVLRGRLLLAQNHTGT